MLEYLKDQKDKPDSELLEDLKWTPEQLRQFQEKWEQMREKAAKGDRSTRKKYENALQSLGLTPQRDANGSVEIENEKAKRNMSESGSRIKPPAHLMDDFRSFKRKRSGVRK